MRDFIDLFQRQRSGLTADDINSGKRAHDYIATYTSVADIWDLKTKWVAIRLSDGGSDGQIYDSKRDAVRHQDFEQQCMYINFGSMLASGGSNARELAIMIAFHRDAYKKGMRLADPDDITGGRQLIMQAEDYDRYTGRVRG